MWKMFLILAPPTPAVDIQVQTYAQIPIHAQIPAYVQLPTLFQPHVPSQPSAHLHCSQVPHPATISIVPVLGQDTNHFHKPSIISEEGNKTAVFALSAPVILATGSQVYWKDHSPSIVPIQFLHFLLTCSCFNTPDHPCLLDPRSCDLSSLDYYSSMISLV